MKKLIFNFFLIIFSIFILLIILLSTIGIETERFNRLISQKINRSNNNLILQLQTVKFKLDLKEVRLFLQTYEPQIEYRNIIIPLNNIKVYINFFSLIKAQTQFEKTILTFNEIDIERLKDLSSSFKPSNFTSFIKNKVESGKIKSEIEIYLNKENSLETFIARGSVTNFKTKIVENLSINKSSFPSLADETDVLIKNFFGFAGPIRIFDGDIKVKLKPEVSLNSNFNADLKYNKKLKNYNKLFKEFEIMKYIQGLEGELKNSFNIDLDSTYKVKKYEFQSGGNISKANLYFTPLKKNLFIKEKIDRLFFTNSQINININSSQKNIGIKGEYSFDGKKFLSFNSKNILDDKLMQAYIEADYDKEIIFDLINYNKPRDDISNIKLNFNKEKEVLNIKKFSIKENKNSINLEGLIVKNGKPQSLKKLSVNTFKNGKKNNDFNLIFGKKISIKGKQFDGANLPKIINKKGDNNIFSKISKDIEISLENINAPLSENMKNFRLIGIVEKGKFIKISSKGDFGNNNYLDISMKNDDKNKKKYLEIYSDIAKPLLTEFSFFNDLSGGNLFFTSVIDEASTTSKLKIENFKVINAPGLIKLLSLADLGGLVDLAEGEGISFETLDIKMEKTKNNLKLNEILALGPSISVLMEGYQDQNVTSLRGTLVPAKTLNKMISRIPVIGDIVIPKEVGEGLFGISFKMKGPTENIKTSINPIRTITPRFIQKIIDKKKEVK